ncbi:XkdX family protein [Fructilactobacillus sp. Tb1]|uniref:XkdX family protein n=1 Tax=Fructilactobacillus sp. Tb1 TaxID=3422304 RepID=UPI003D29DBC7
MSWKKLVKFYFDNNMYDKKDVAAFVNKGSITPDDYADITGETYIAPQASTN